MKQQVITVKQKERLDPKIKVVKHKHFSYIKKLDAFCIENCSELLESFPRQI